MTLPQDPAGAATPPVSAGDQADRLLRGMHKTFSHDLPNQMVVLQSLLQLLHAEEADRLSPDGREYVQRLLNVSRKAAGMVRFLKEMGRLNGYTARPEEVTLPALARELKAEVARLFPHRAFTFDGDWDVPAVQADPKLFTLALVELLRCCVDRTAGPACHVHGASRLTPDGVEVSFHVEAARLDNGSAAPEPRTDLLLAREWLAAWGAHLSFAEGGTGFTVLIPDPVTHG